MSTLSPARLAAVHALLAVEDGAHLDQTLADRAPPDGPDRDLAWFLAFGVVRRRSEVDAALRPRLSRPLTGLDPAVRAVLRIGAFEKLFARTRPHAVVHQAVELMKAVGPARASGLVNAVIRRVAPARDLRDAEAHNLPDWLWDRWVARYGDEVARAWGRQLAEPPPIFVVTPDPTAPPAALPAGAVPESDLVGTYRVLEPSGRVETWAGFDAGRWWVQDRAAVQMADLVGEVEGARVLDACAAPGSKAFRIASRGARVVAVDRDEARLAKLREGAARLSLAMDVRVHDWEAGTGAFSAFDAVLVDAPCTALGTLRRHPEVRWRRQPADLAGVAERQGALMNVVAELVRPGGVLVYSVCSPEPEEGPEVVARFVERQPGFVVDVEVTTAPPQQGEDAHYGCRLRRDA